MADLSVSSTVSAAFAIHPGTRIRDYIAGGTITVGYAVYQNSSGKMVHASAGASGTKQFRGIALKSAVSGQAVPILEEGEVDGFDLSGIAFDGLVYLSDTAGRLADSQGTAAVTVGRVKTLPVVDDSTSALRKILYVQAKENANW